MSITSQYLANVFTPRRLRFIVQGCVNRLRPLINQFDTIVFRGMSGAIVAPMVAARLQKKLLLIRKPTDKTHSVYQIEGHVKLENYVVVDDFVSTGDTIKTIYDSVNRHVENAKLIAVVAYGRWDSYWNLGDEKNALSDKLGMEIPYIPAFTKKAWEKLRNMTD